MMYVNFKMCYPLGNVVYGTFLTFVNIETPFSPNKEKQIIMLQ